MSSTSAVAKRVAAEPPSLLGVPEIEYPSPLATLPEEPHAFLVKNTFVAIADCQPSSLLGSSVLMPRAVRSCPGSKCVGLFGGLDSGCYDECQESAGSSPRSTSVGASPCMSDTEDDACSTSTRALPQFEYPTFEVSVRNTFIDTRTGAHLPSMVDDGYKERKVQSCPTSRLGEFEGASADPWSSLQTIVAQARSEEDEEDDHEFTPSPDFSPGDEDDEDWGCLPAFVSFDAMEDIAMEYTRLAESPWAPLSFVPMPPLAPLSVPAMSVPSMPPPPPPAAPPAVPEESTSLVASPPHAPPTVEPLLGSPEFPTVGSRLHCQGDCRPCAHGTRCRSGVECQFCHLCAPGELKRRQKERRAQLAREQAAENRAEGMGGCTRGRRGGRQRT